MQCSYTCNKQRTRRGHTHGQVESNKRKGAMHAARRAAELNMPNGHTTLMRLKNEPCEMLGPYLRV